MRDHLPILIPLGLWAGAWAVAALGPLSYRLSRLAGYLGWALSLVFACLALPVVLAQGPWHYSLGGWPPPWGIEVVLGPLTLFLSFFVLGAGLLGYASLGPFGLLAGLLKSRETLAGSLLLWMAGSLAGILVVRDGFTLYLLVQAAVSAGAGLLVGITRKGTGEGFRFLLWGSLAATLFLSGFLVLHASAGTFHLSDLRAQLFMDKSFDLAQAAGILFTGSLAAVFLFPLPFLQTPAFTQGPLFLWGFLSALLPRIALFLLFLVLFFVLNLPGMVPPAWFTGAAGLLALLPLGAFVLAARQKDLLSAVAYLSLAQLGFPLLGFVCGNKSSMTGSLLELVSQVIGVFGLFLAVEMAAIKKAGSHPLAQLSGLGRQDPGAALIWVVLVFSVAGVPPTGGCFGKYYLLQGLIEKKDWALLAPLALVLLFNLVMVFRFLWLLFEHRTKVTMPAALSAGSRARLYFLAFLLLVLGGFHTQIVRRFIEPALPKAYQNIPLPDVPFLGKQVE
ncbi:MAG TPA: proton-conducting transporter membrane subunit [bacterium]|nr:proton-conducting transporter membrane subunit [bacterium]